MSLRALSPKHTKEHTTMAQARKFLTHPLHCTPTKRHGPTTACSVQQIGHAHQETLRDSMPADTHGRRAARHSQASMARQRPARVNRVMGGQTGAAAPDAPKWITTRFASLPSQSLCSKSSKFLVLKLMVTMVGTLNNHFL